MSQSSLDGGSMTCAPETIAYTMENGERAFYRRDADAERYSIYMNPSATKSHRSFFSATSSNATMANIAGPGRLLGNFLEAAGGSVERNLGLLAYKAGLHPAARAEQRLKHWSPNSEADAVFLLQCLAASDRPPLQFVAFRVYIDFVINRLTRYWLNNHRAIEGYQRLRLSFQRAIRKNPSLALSSWKGDGIAYDETWLLYFEAAGFLLSLGDVESWIAAQIHYLRVGHVEWMSGYTSHERLLVCFIGVWICNEPEAWMSPWQHTLSFIVLNQVQLGPACKEKGGVALLASALIARTLEDVCIKPWAIYDDDNAIKNLFAVIEQIRRWEVLFPIAFDELQKKASEICKLFLVLDNHSPVNKGSKIHASLRVPQRRFLACEDQFNHNFVMQGSRWSVRTWTTSE